MERWSGKVAIVTGASVGIGAETTEALVKHGVTVVALARRIEKIRELQSRLANEKGRIHPIRCDLSKESDILSAFETVEREFGGVDILINNAGVLSGETIIDGKTETFRNIFDVNVIAFAICAREAIKSMRKRNFDGHIIVVNSVLGHNADLYHLPVSVYSASKYAVTGMVATLRIELSRAQSYIKLTSVSPGLVDTELAVNAGYNRDEPRAPIVLQPKDVTDAIIYALSTPPDIVVQELMISSSYRLKTPSTN